MHRRFFRIIARDNAAALRFSVPVATRTRCSGRSQQITDALNKGDITLAQSRGLRIPVRQRDDRPRWPTGSL
jgi:hypothetical protein